MTLHHHLKYDLSIPQPPPPFLLSLLCHHLPTMPLPYFVAIFLLFPIHNKLYTFMPSVPSWLTGSSASIQNPCESPYPHVSLLHPSTNLTSTLLPSPSTFCANVNGTDGQRQAHTWVTFQKWQTIWSQLRFWHFIKSFRLFFSFPFFPCSFIVLFFSPFLMLTVSVAFDVLTFRFHFHVPQKHLFTFPLQLL